MESKFKVGDKVRINLTKDDSITTEALKDDNRICTIEKIEKYNNFCFFMKEDTYLTYFFKTELEHSRICNTRLARKIYPKAEISEDGEWLYV